MKKTHLIFSGLFLFLSFACNNDSFLEQAYPIIEVDCRADYPDNTNIRLASINEFTYEFDLLDETLQVVGLKNSDIAVKWIYENNKIIREEQYQLPSNELSLVKQMIYDDKDYLKEESTYQNITGFSNTFTTLYETDENGRKIRAQQIFEEEGVIHNSCLETFEWDDCNMIKKNIFDENGIQGYELNYFYDDKLNPYNLLPSMAIGFNALSKNNAVIFERKSLNNPNYTGITFTGENSNAEVNYEYNEYNLPIKKIKSNNQITTYSYKID